MVRSRSLTTIVKALSKSWFDFSSSPDGSKCEVRDITNNHLSIKEDILLSLEWFENLARWFNRRLSPAELSGAEGFDMDCSHFFDALREKTEEVCSYPGVNAVTLWGWTLFALGLGCSFGSIFFALLKCSITTSDWEKEDFGLHDYLDACKQGNSRLAHLHLRVFVTPDAADRLGNTGLHWGVMSNNPTLCHLLLENKLDPNKFNSLRYTPLHVAFLE